MPKYSSKTQSKNGGRRRKQTKRKLRRGKKSRKVMRGGGGEALEDFMITVQRENPDLSKKFEETYYTKYGKTFNRWTATKDELKALDPGLKAEMTKAGFDIDNANYQ